MNRFKELFTNMLICAVLAVFNLACSYDNLLDTRAVHFITYGNDKFKKSRERINQEAIDTGWFTSTKIYTPENIGDNFTKRHATFLRKNTRGGGYWIWKPYIILKHLETMNDGDFLVYLDSGSTVNTGAKSRLNAYLNILENDKKGVLGFQMRYIEKCWTKNDLAVHLDVADKSSFMDSGQVMATAAIFQKNQYSMKLVKEWYDLASAQNYHFLDDSPSISDNADCFEEHRHDQSIFSLLIKKLDTPLLGDEIQTRANNKPFWATRKRE